MEQPKAVQHHSENQVHKYTGDGLGGNFGMMRAQNIQMGALDTYSLNFSIQSKSYVASSA